MYETYQSFVGASTKYNLGSGQQIVHTAVQNIVLHYRHIFHRAEFKIRDVIREVVGDSLIAMLWCIILVVVKVIVYILLFQQKGYIIVTLY
jgi:ABC-type proline/glycine betaine transport system permease subunit